MEQLLPKWWREMDSELKDLIMTRFHQGPPLDCTVVEGSTPIVAFGKFLTAKIATVSLNPSYEEFDSEMERFHTLTTLGVSDYDQIEENHAVEILRMCMTYFSRNVAYDWFSPLEEFLVCLVGAGFNSGLACHLDISPWATNTLWKDLTTDQKESLVGILDKEILRSLVKHFHYDRLFLNGVTASKSVLEDFFQVKYNIHSLEGLSQKTEVYYCTTDKLFGFELGRTIEAFGWNFYLQRGVKDDRKNAVIDWYKLHSKL